LPTFKMTAFDSDIEQRVLPVRPTLRWRYDIGYFVSHSTPPALRREIEFDLLRAYHDRQVRLRRWTRSSVKCWSIKPSACQMIVIGYVAHQSSATIFARIGIMRALNRHHVRESTQSRKSRIGAGASWPATANFPSGDHRNEFLHADIDIFA
jgi:hypothetical protein